MILREFNTWVGYLPLSADKLHTRRCLASRRTPRRQGENRIFDWARFMAVYCDALLPLQSSGDIREANEDSSYKRSELGQLKKCT
jgi:hypothetical protein